MRKLLTGIALIVLQVAVYGQTLLSSANSSMKLVIHSKGGYNGLAVTYNPKTQLYYTVFAGNQMFPLEVFNSGGDFVAGYEAGFDLRGMWYNKKKNTLDGIQFQNEAACSIELTASGEVGQKQGSDFSYEENPNSVGVYHEKYKKVLFVTNEGVVNLYTPGKNAVKTIDLQVNGSLKDYNLRAPVCTSVKGRELALFNIRTLKLDFFDLKTGAMNGSVKLNLVGCNSGFALPDNFRLAYANNLVWVYDTDSRTWYGFNVWG